MRRALSGCLAAWVLSAHGPAHADDPPPDAASPPTTDPAPPEPSAAAPGEPAPAHDPAAPADDRHGELIEVTGSAPTPPGTISLDASTARQTAGALGEPFRALALLPGVATSIAASGYPIIRGTLPGESRYTFDGIEIPMLYHLLLGNQVIHPSFIGELELRAGGHGAEQGHLVGGLVTMTPAATDQVRTELRANPVEIGAFRAQPLSPTTSIAAAARVGTLAIAARLYDHHAALYYVDQQTRLVHRFSGGDVLTVTSLAAYDYLREPPDYSASFRTHKLGFHRLDARWTRRRAGGQLRAGIESSLDTLSEVLRHLKPPLDSDGRQPPTLPTEREGGRSWGVRAYGDGRLVLAPWLAARGGLEARHRTLVNGEFPFELTRSNDPFLGLARTVDAQGAWAALELRAGPLRITPGVRADDYHVELYGAAVRHVTVDPRLAIAADLPGGARAELAAGGYSAPPQVSVFAGNFVIGPLPMTDGAASNAGMNHAIGAELSVHTPLPGGLQGSFAAYYRNTHHAVDFGMRDKPFVSGALCDSYNPTTLVYRDIDTRALGVEAMIRRELGRAVTGWVSYSLARLDRDFGFIQLPDDFDQRHTVNATVQWRRGRWALGATGHVHTGRPVMYPQYATCANGFVGTVVSADKLRRLPTTWRIDLRAERAFELGGWQMRAYFEMQNASLTREVVDYHLEPIDLGNPTSYHVVEGTLFVPLPLVGLEVVL